MLRPFLVLLASFDVMALPKAQTPAKIEAVQLAPVFQQSFFCGEHPEGSLHYVGDALGRDCVIVGGVDPLTSEGFPRPFRGDGAKNSDWYGFHADVHAPFDGVVEGVHDNPVESEPGDPSEHLAGYIGFRRPDGLQVTYAHTVQPTVKVGDHVHAGQVVAWSATMAMLECPTSISALGEAVRPIRSGGTSARRVVCPRFSTRDPDARSADPSGTRGVNASDAEQKAAGMLNALPGHLTQLGLVAR